MNKKLSSNDEINYKTIDPDEISDFNKSFENIKE
jgi:hypothetical protein